MGASRVLEAFVGGFSLVSGALTLLWIPQAFLPDWGRSGPDGWIGVRLLMMAGGVLRVLSTPELPWLGRSQREFVPRCLVRLVWMHAVAGALFLAVVALLLGSGGIGPGD